MKTKPKKELVYIAIIAGFSIIVVILLFNMFQPKRDRKEDVKENAAAQIYQAGVYTKEIQIGDAVVPIQLCLNESNVKSVELVNMDDTITAMYPLIVPTIEKISEQLSSGKSVEDIVLTDEAQYTEKIILEAVSGMLREHRVIEAP